MSTRKQSSSKVPTFDVCPPSRSVDDEATADKASKAANDGPQKAQLNTPALPTKPAPKTPRYQYLLPNRARWAMERVMTNLHEGQRIMRAVRVWEQRQKQGMAELDTLVAQLSDLDHRKAAIVRKLNDLRLNLPEIGGLIADMALENTAAEKTLTETITHGRREMDTPRDEQNGKPPEWGTL